MQLKTVFTVNYIYSFLFGAGFIFFPTTCSSLVGFDSAGDSFLIARCLGIFVIFSGVLTYSARNAEQSAARRAIVGSLLTLYTLLLLYKVALNLVYGIQFSVIFALIYALHIGLVGAYLHHLLEKPREAGS
jgi:hypothetical protein